MDRKSLDASTEAARMVLAQLLWPSCGDWTGVPHRCLVFEVVISRRSVTAGVGACQPLYNRPCTLAPLHKYYRSSQAGK